MLFVGSRWTIALMAIFCRRYVEVSTYCRLEYYMSTCCRRPSDVRFFVLMFSPQPTDVLIAALCSIFSSQRLQQ